MGRGSENQDSAIAADCGEVGRGVHRLNGFADPKVNNRKPCPKGRQADCTTVGDDDGYVLPHSPSKHDLVDSKMFGGKAQGVSSEPDGASTRDSQDDPVAQHCFCGGGFAELKLHHAPRLGADTYAKNALVGEDDPHFAPNPMPQDLLVQPEFFANLPSGTAVECEKLAIDHQNFEQLRKRYVIQAGDCLSGLGSGRSH